MIINVASRRVLLAIGCYAALASEPCHAITRQAESSVVCRETAEPLALAYGQYTTGCALAQPTDLDRFTLAATAGETLRVTLLSLATGLDPRVEVRDPGGTVLATPACTGGGGRCAFLMDIPVATGGTHQLAVSDGGADETGGYLLQVERVPPPADLVALPYNLAVVDQVDPQTDRDCMSWEAAAGTMVRFTLLSRQNGLDPELEVRDPDGAQILVASCVGGGGRCSLARDLTPTASGTHTVCFRDGGADESGAYEVNLQCLVGNCPSLNRRPALTPIGARSVGVGQNLDLALSATDADGDVLRLEVDGAPVGAIFTDGGDGSGQFSWTPGAVGEFAVRFTVTDDGAPPLSDGEEVTIVVGPPNRPPALTAINAQSVAAGQRLTVPLTASDQDGDVVAFSAIDLPPGADLTDNGDLTATLTWSPTPSQIGAYSVTIQASDTGVPAKSARQLVAISVTPAPITESSMACNEATEPLALAYGQYTTGCVLAQPTDLDRFTLAATAGETLRVTLLSLTNGLDPRVEVRDRGGTVLATPACTGGGGRCAFLMDIPVATGGAHQLAVSDGGADETGGYLLQVERVPPPADLVALPYNLAVVDQVNPQTDRDCMSWEAAVGTMVRFTLLSRQNGLDPELEVRDPDGAQILVASCVGGGGRCSLARDLTPTASGTHTVCFRDSGADESGAYEVNLQCLFGDCPAGTSPPTCGNGIVDAGEDCDPGLTPACCTASCSPAPAGQQCRPPAGNCDTSEVCTGSSAECPPDRLRLAGTVCRESAGPCDLAETCTGTAAACPSDGLMPSSVVCRPGAGACDPPERCPGTGPTCPADTVAPSTMICRPAAGTCDAAERCNGQSPACPADASQPDGTTCNDGQSCTNPDTCQNGRCTGPARPCDDGNGCTTDRCDESRDQCVSSAEGGRCDDENPCTDDACTATGCRHTPVVGRACDDGLACTVGETCQGDQTCSGGTARTCPAPDTTCAEARCDEAAGGCTTVPGANGLACDDGNPCTTGETCQAGTCTSGASVSCDDQDACTADRCAATGQCEHVPSADGAACDNGNEVPGDVCRAGGCTDPRCDGVPDGTSCDDGNGCTDADLCRAGVCVAGEPPVCRVELACPVEAQVCRIRALCTRRRCRVSITVRFEAPARSRCRVVLRLPTGGALSGRGLAQATGAKTGKKAKVLGVAKGRVGSNGQLTLVPKLNRLGRKLLGNAPAGMLEAQAEATIRAPQESSVRTRLLPRLIQIVRGL